MSETTTVQHYRRIFDAAALPGRELTWLDRLRADAMARFEEQGLPHPKAEAWKFTNLRAIEKLAPEEAPDDVAAPDRLPSLVEGEMHPRLVFVNGRFRADLSRLDALPAGVTAMSLGEALDDSGDWLADRLGSLAEENHLAALNTAMLRDGLMLHVPNQTRVEQPIEVVYVDQAGDGPSLSNPRCLIVMEPMSEAILIEHHASAGDVETVANAVAEVILEDGAILHHAALHDRSDKGYHLGALTADLGKDARYDFFTLVTGGALTRQDLTVRLSGSGAHCDMNGAYLLGGKAHSDITSIIEHRVPDTSCQETVRGALDDKARGVFQGLVRVCKDAQRSDGHQSHKALLLSRDAEVDAKPELEIFADDVACSHGATAGEIDADALFYLRSRGINEKRARDILVEAFLAEAANLFGVEALREALVRRITRRREGGAA